MNIGAHGSGAEPLEQAKEDETASLEEGIDEILAEHGGDARAAIRALLQSASCLEKARDRALVLVSYGYARGKVE
jgi:DNA polymerase III delta prime subunit